MSSTKTYLDLTSLYQLIIALGPTTSPTLRSWSRWEWEEPLRLTALLVAAPTTTYCIANPPDTRLQPSGQLGTAVKRLSEISATDAPGVTPEEARRAQRRTRRWAGGHADRVRSVLSALKSDNGDYVRWITGHVAYAWREHNQRLDGLFEQDSITLISKVTGRPENELRIAREESRVDETLRRYAGVALAGGLPDDDLFSCISDAYTTSVLIRGRYYDEMAYKYHVRLHPVRDRALLRPPVQESATELTSYGAITLASLILNSAYVERTHEARIGRWADNLGKARKSDLEARMPPGPPNDYGTRDWKQVQDLLKNADIGLHPELHERLVEGAVIFSGIALPDVTAKFLFQGLWPELSFYIIEYLAVRTIQRQPRLEAKAIARRMLGYSERKVGNLRRLADFPPGRID